MPRQKSLPLHTRQGRRRRRPREPPAEPPDEGLTGTELGVGLLSEETGRMIGSHLKHPRHGVTKEGIEKSLRLINDSVTRQGDIIRLCERRLERYGRRKVLSSTVAAVRDRIQSHVETLRGDGERRVKRSEEAVRRLVDFKAELQYRKALLREVASSIQNNEPVSGNLADAMSNRLSMWDKETGEKSMLERYGQNTEYTRFKNIWHEAMHDDSAILPHPKKWFDENGTAVWEFGSDGPSEDEVVVAREITSMKCPLQLTIMEEPYANSKCKHSCEKTAILEYLNGRTKECPQFGCSKSFGPEDLFFDEKMARRIERLRKQGTLGTGHDIAGDQTIGSDDSDAEMISDHEQKYQPGRASIALDESSWR